LTNEIVESAVHAVVYHCKVFWSIIVLDAIVVMSIFLIAKWAS